MRGQFNFIDKLVIGVDSAIRSVFIPETRAPFRASPANHLPEAHLTSEQKRHIAGLMRVNHTGEVCAQALYLGQATTAHLTEVKTQMQQAASEEVDHLAWCEQRLRELNSQPSYLNPLWYGASFMIGALAGLAGDRWSLGFVAETERQVSAHLQRHLVKLPADDVRSRAILAQMQSDEIHHAEMAIAAGAMDLPILVKKLMSSASKSMTFISYYI